MNLNDRAKADIEQITSNKDSGFGVEMTLTAPDNTVVTIVGLHTKIHLALDTEGLMVNSKKAHVSFSEKFLTDESYPLRNDNGEVDLRKHV
jgi:hypothetical protein